MLKKVIKPHISSMQLVETHLSVKSTNSTVRASIGPSWCSTFIDENLKNSVWQFLKQEIFIKRDVILGKGMFSKCFLGTVGPLNEVCIKVIRNGSVYQKSFYNEVNILSTCCHSNIIVFALKEGSQ